MQSAHCPSVMTKSINPHSPPKAWVSFNASGSWLFPHFLLVAEPSKSNFFSHYLGPQDEGQLFGMRLRICLGRKLILLVWCRTRSLCWGGIGLYVVVREDQRRKYVCITNYWVTTDGCVAFKGMMGKSKLLSENTLAAIFSTS